MPQFTYDDMKHKILKRERYKFALNYHQQFFPIFKENETYFDESKGFKRFLRLIRFYVNLPRTSDVKKPYNAFATMMPKQVNFVKAQVITAFKSDITTDPILVTTNTPYNFMKSNYPFFASGTENITGKGRFNSEPGMFTEVIDNQQTSTLTSHEKARQAFSTYPDGLTAQGHVMQADVSFNLLTNISADQLANNDKSYVDTFAITHPFKNALENAGTIYEFFGSPDSFEVPRKIAARPYLNSTSKELYLTKQSSVTFKEDKKHDLQILSEISLHDNRIIINLFENIRSVSEINEDSAILELRLTTDMKDKQVKADAQGCRLADYDYPLTLDKYFLYDLASGAADELSATKITGSMNEAPETDQKSIRQYLSQLQGYIEFEVILVDMALKR